MKKLLLIKILMLFVVWVHAQPIPENTTEKKEQKKKQDKPPVKPKQNWKSKYDVVDDFSEGLAFVKLNGKYGFIDKIGKEVIPLKYDATEWFFRGKALVLLNNEWFYIDKLGNRIKN